MMISDIVTGLEDRNLALLAKMLSQQSNDIKELAKLHGIPLEEIMRVMSESDDDKVDGNINEVLDLARQGIRKE